MDRSYQYCEWITAHHYENFPVASWLLPARLRPHVAAIYAFARVADDFADEARYQGRSLELLDQWRAALWGCVPGSGPAFTPSSSPSLNKPKRMEIRDVVQAEPLPGVNPATHPIFIALAQTIREFDLPVEWLDDLLTAFTMDVTKRRYANWEELMTYCRYSANPVGRLVLALFGIRDAALQHQSDCICSGLQLANHWQDLRIDLARNMNYIPQDLMRRHGVTDSDLQRYGSAAEGGQPAPCSGSPRPFPQQNPADGSAELRAASGCPPPSAYPDTQFRTLMQELVARARVLFDEGEPLTRQLRGGLRLEIKLTVLGGRAILDRIEKSNYDVFRRRLTLSTLDKVQMLVQATVSKK